jgi:GcrA cell cycle regulator
MSWSDKEIAHLRTRWGVDTPRAIAVVVGKSRNAVIGKAHRLGLPDLGNPVGGGSREKHAPKPRPPYTRRDESGDLKRTGVRAARLLKKAETDRPKAPAALPVAPPVVIPSRFSKAKAVPYEGPALPLPALGSGQCVWPVESGAQGHRFCGEPVDPGKPYCAAHRARAKGAQSAESMAAGRENARRAAALSHARYGSSGPGFIQSNRARGDSR